MRNTFGDISDTQSMGVGKTRKKGTADDDEGDDFELNVSVGD